MRLVHTQDILMDLSWPQAIEEKLGRVALGSETEMRLTNEYAPREFIVQYDESDLALVSRLSALKRDTNAKSLSSYCTMNSRGAYSFVNRISVSEPRATRPSFSSMAWGQERSIKMSWV